MSERLELAPTPSSVGEARRWSADVVERAGSPEVVEALVLLASELVSNVVLHARTPCEVSIDRVDDHLRVEVRDGSDRLPTQRPVPDPLALSGRGMLLVDRLSDRHGAEPLAAGGKLVWFELTVPAEGEA